MPITASAPAILIEAAAHCAPTSDENAPMNMPPTNSTTWAYEDSHRSATEFGRCGCGPAGRSVTARSKLSPRSKKPPEPYMRRRSRTRRSGSPLERGPTLRATLKTIELRPTAVRARNSAVDATRSPRRGNGRYPRYRAGRTSRPQLRLVYRHHHEVNRAFGHRVTELGMERWSHGLSTPFL